MDELEKLICKIYEDNALGKMLASKYETLVRHYSNEQNELKEKIEEIEDCLLEIEKTARAERNS